MSDQTTQDEQSAAATTDSATGDESADDREQKQEQNHDCQQHLEFVDYEWVDDTYDDKYVCSVCEAEYRMVYAKAFLLDGENYSLVEEYTDEIERKLDLHRKRARNDANETEEASDE
jgi:hypothetical protein